jgi:serine/threonine-protein kinase
VTVTTAKIPQRMGRYRIDGVLGEGAHGVVYQAYDPRGQRPVAIKALRREVASGPFGARLLEQARAAARLSHPGIVTIHEVDESDGPAFIVMEHVAGLNLSQWLAATPLPPQGSLLKVMDQLLDAVEFAHRAGVRHGGLKPANVLITATGHVKLSDFGVARLDNGGVASGMPSRMLAPEISLGRAVNNGVDVYAAGVLLYRMLTGRDLAFGDVDEGSISAARAPSTFAEAARPAVFDAIVARAMAREPVDRYPTAEAFRDALRKVRDQHHRPVHGSGSVELDERPSAPSQVRRLTVAATRNAKYAKAIEAAAAKAAVPVVKTPPSGSDLPVLTIAIPDEVLAMPAYDPWADTSTDPPETMFIPPPTSTPFPTLTEVDIDLELGGGGGVRAGDPSARESAASAAHAANQALTSASQGSAGQFITAEPFTPPSESVFGGDPMAVLPPMPVSPDIPDEALRRVLIIITPHFGAAAGTVLKQAAGRASGIAELHEMLLEAAGETVDKRKLRKQLKALAKLPL